MTVQKTALTDEQTLAFDEWVGRRLADWSVEDIRAFERWLLDDCRFEFIPAVRKVCTTRSSLSESAS